MYNRYGFTAKLSNAAMQATAPMDAQAHSAAESQRRLHTSQIEAVRARNAAILAQGDRNLPYFRPTPSPSHQEMASFGRAASGGLQARQGYAPVQSPAHQRYVSTLQRAAHRNRYNSMVTPAIGPARRTVAPPQTVGRLARAGRYGAVGAGVLGLGALGAAGAAYAR